MQLHIDDGCADCANLVRLYEQIVRVGERLKLYEPGAEDVRVVKAAFDAGSAQPRTTRLPGKVAFELLLDSFLQPVAAGTRSSIVAARQLLYRAGSLYVDIRLESMPAGRVSLVGQVLDSSKTGAPLKEVAVVLFAGRKPLERTATNISGEFQFEFELQKSLTLSVAAKGKSAVSLPLRDFSAQELPPAMPKERG